MHNFAKFVLASPSRREEFHKILQAKQPDLRRGLLPLADVRTRWNSTYEAICRILLLKETVIAYSRMFGEDGCPMLGRDVFQALETLKLPLASFQGLTKRYSKVEVNIHRVLVDLSVLIQTLQAGMLTSAPDRRSSFRMAIAKLQKYLRIMLQNDWICAATILNPYMRERGFSKLAEANDLSNPRTRTEEVVAWILRRAGSYEASGGTPEGSQDYQMDTQDDMLDLLESNPFELAHSSQDVGTSSGDEIKDAWNEFNAQQPVNHDTKPKPTRVPGQSMLRNEPIEAYWRRQSLSNSRLQPLTRVARDLLAIRASSTSVERLFSQSGNTLGHRRKAMQPEMVLKQTSLKIWDAQGLCLMKDIEAVC